MTRTESNPVQWSALVQAVMECVSIILFPSFTMANNSQVRGPVWTNPDQCSLSASAGGPLLVRRA
jgi:hypothetical protein